MLHTATVPIPPRTYKWAYGVTTIPQRRHQLLPLTLESLKAAGFDSPRLFIDGVTSQAAEGWEKEFGLSVTSHWPNIRTVGNWVLALWELYIRTPTADRFAIFQDDILLYKNLRQYLDSQEYPSHAYWNLYTFSQNKRPADPFGRDMVGWYTAPQYGKGAVAIVLDRARTLSLLSARSLIEKPAHPSRGHINLDGAIWQAFSKIGIREFVHHPSLVQHEGLLSSIENSHSASDTFLGRKFDAMNLIRGQVLTKTI